MIPKYQRINRVGEYWKKKYGAKTYKLIFKGQFTCPNIDETLSDKGCIYCNMKSLEPLINNANIEEHIKYLEDRNNAKLFYAFFQDYSSTYPVNSIKNKYEYLKELYTQSIDNDKIIFVPDRNLGAYVASQIPEKEFIFWDGYCPVHDDLRRESVEKLKREHPAAKVAAHPECRGDILAVSDFIGSTKAILEYVTTSKEKEFIIATEIGVIDRLSLIAPGKTTYLAQVDMICADMKKIDMEKLFTALNEEKYIIELEKDIMDRARGCLERMVAAV